MYFMFIFTCYSLAGFVIPQSSNGFGKFVSLPVRKNVTMGMTFGLWNSC